jgi:hypothetical protein
MRYRIRRTALRLALGLVTACAAPRAQPAEADAAALAFAQALGAGDAARAHEMLSASLQSTLTPAQLGTAYREMTAYGSGVPTRIAVQTTLDSWPDRTPDDLRWVYVAIANDTFSEGVSVVVTQERSRLAIRSFQLGRP